MLQCLITMLLLQFKLAIVVMGRPKYLPDDGDHAINLDDFQSPHWGRGRSYEGNWIMLTIRRVTIHF